MVKYARIAKNIADARRGFRAAAAAGFDLDVIESYARVHGRAAFVRALKPPPLPDSIFKGESAWDSRWRRGQSVIQVEQDDMPSLSFSMVEFRAIWCELKPKVPPASEERKSRIDDAIRLSKTNETFFN